MDKPRSEAGMRILLLCTVFIISTCGLIYELISGTLASYLLGDSVTQFSTIIGSYLFAMGIGSWLSGYIKGNLLRWFISVEILVGLIGGLSAAALFILFEQAASFRVLLYGIVSVIGVLVGLEIPLLMRLLKDEYSFEHLVSRIFTFDYIGSLLASIIFPLVLVPYLGLIRSAVLFGMLNVAVAAFALFRLQAARPLRKGLTPAVTASSIVLIACYFWAGRIQTFSESLAFHDNVIFSKSTPYQRIVLTRGREDLRLYLNGNLQFSSRDEYRYHEALVHPVLGGIRRRDSILVLGGGDGLALREILKYPDVAHVDLVDLDPAMTQIFSKDEMLTKLNKGSFTNPKVRVRNMDAFRFVRETRQQYAAIIVDFPDPGNFSVGKLYTTAFYQSLRNMLRDDGALVVQSTSPFVARKSFWCVAHTLGGAGFRVMPYHAYVPSFGEWGYVLGTKTASWRRELSLPPGLRFLTSVSMGEMLRFPPDMAELPTDTNRLNNAVLVHYFEEEWSHYVNVQ
jgi:spermidine synthase